MKLLVAGGPLKGSFTARGAALAMARGLARERGVSLAVLPLGDGGDGTASALARALGGQPVRTRAPDALGEARRTAWWRLGRGASPSGAALDLASVCGLARLIRHHGRPAPLAATTQGLGMVLAEVLAREDSGPVWVGLGGSASTDGGLGLFTSLGGVAVDRYGRPVPPGGQGLLHLTHLDASRVPRRLLARVWALCDVSSPLLGPEGSAPMFGPQKGATPQEVHRLAEGLARLAEVAAQDLAADPHLGTQPMTGSAGGTAFLLSALGAHLAPGAPTVARLAGVRTALATRHALLTCEGHLDDTTLRGKLPWLLVGWAQEMGKGAGVVCGSADPQVRRQVEAQGVVVEEAAPEGSWAGASQLAQAARRAYRRLLAG
jgi:glycerate kinase